MGTYLHCYLLPLSKLTAKGKISIEEARKLLGFDRWLRLKPIRALLKNYPGLKDNLEKDFEKLFESKELNLFETTFFVSRCFEKFKIRSQELNAALESFRLKPEWLHQYVDYFVFPFHQIHFINTTSWTIISRKIEAKLGTKLPVKLNEFSLVFGEPAAIIPIAVLNKTNFDELKTTLLTDPFVKDEDFNWCLDPLINVLKEAKRLGCDVVFTYA